MTVQQAQQSMTSSEFIDWLYYLDAQENARTKLDYYLAQIALETRRSYVKNPEKIKMDEFLLQFRLRREEDRRRPSEAERAERIARSKAFWLGALGLKGEG